MKRHAVVIRRSRRRNSYTLDVLALDARIKDGTLLKVERLLAEQSFPRARAAENGGTRA
jgi:hypothetical protein